MEKGDHAFSTPTLRIKKEREREREREGGGGGRGRASEKQISCASAKTQNQENIKVRELLSHIGPKPIVIPLKISIFPEICCSEEG